MVWKRYHLIDISDNFSKRPSQEYTKTQDHHHSYVYKVSKFMTKGLTVQIPGWAG